MPDSLLDGLRPAHPYIKNRLPEIRGIEHRTLVSQIRLAMSTGLIDGLHLIEEFLVEINGEAWERAIILQDNVDRSAFVLCANSSGSVASYTRGNMPNSRTSSILNAIAMVTA